MKYYILVFLYALGLNLIWENLHSFLYLHYKNGPITEFILARAAIADAFIILILAAALNIFKLKSYPGLIIISGIIISVIIEYWALGSGRWAYLEIMPLIPFIKIGLTPTIQLGLLGYISYKLSFGK